MRPLTALGADVHSNALSVDKDRLTAGDLQQVEPCLPLYQKYPDLSIGNELPVDPGARSICSRTKYGLFATMILVADKRSDAACAGAGPATAAPTAPSRCNSRSRPKSNSRKVASLRC